MRYQQQEIIVGRNYADFSGEKNPNFKNGYASTQGRPSFYNSWQNMKGRCIRKSHPKYERYGGRGIKIYEPWLGIDAFAEWALANGWEEGLSLDRIDNDGDYSPQNCRWITTSENSRKKSTTKITLKQAEEIRKKLDRGEDEYDLAAEYGVVHGTIWFIKNRFTHVEEMECTRKKAAIRERNKGQ
jgi:hypothetical protein